jgi:hypothetical protein
MIETGWVKNPNAPNAITPDIKEIFDAEAKHGCAIGPHRPVSMEPIEPSQPLLSILIPTVISRHKKCNELLACLYAQRDALPMKDRVEILTLSDNGEMMVGEKRNKLLEMANGEYLCFFDDDDTPFGNYLVKIIEALETRPDVVGITIFWTDNIFQSVRLLLRSLDYHQYHWLVKSDTVTCGRPAHLNPTRSSIAKSVKFPENMTAGEDAAWSAVVAGKLKTCVNIDAPIYYYNWSATGTITQRPGAREAIRAALPEGHQYAFRDGKIVELDKRGVVVQK